MIDKVKCLASVITSRFVCDKTLSNKTVHCVLEVHMKNHEHDEQPEKDFTIFDQTNLITDLEAVFGESKVLFPGALYFEMPVRLGRDMTNSTDWDLIYVPLHTDRSTRVR